MKNHFNRASILFPMIAFVLLAPSNSEAITTMSVSDGAATITILDDGPNDSSIGLGTVTWNGAIGVWDVNVASGLTKPFSGSATSPDLSLSGVSHSTAAGMLTITFTDTDFVALPVFALSSVGGTQDGNNPSIRYVTLQGADQIADTGLLTQTPFSASILGQFVSTTNLPPLGQTPPYSLTQVITIVHEEAGNTSFGATLTTPVPEPRYTLLFLGIGLATVIAVNGRRREAKH